MIIDKLDLVDYVFELVDDDDILETYRRASSSTSSCMTGSEPEVQNRLKFYLAVKDLKLLRLVTAVGRSVVGRALIWTGKDIENKVVRVMDRIYTNSNTSQRLFKDYWLKFADVSRDTARGVICTINPKAEWVTENKLGRVSLPYLDTFRVVEVNTLRISNKCLPLPEKAKAKKAK